MQWARLLSELGCTLRSTKPKMKKLCFNQVNKLLWNSGVAVLFAQSTILLPGNPDFSHPLLRAVDKQDSWDDDWKQTSKHWAKQGQPIKAHSSS